LENAPPQSDETQLPPHPFVEGPRKWVLSPSSARPFSYEVSLPGGFVIRVALLPPSPPVGPLIVDLCETALGWSPPRKSVQLSQRKGAVLLAGPKAPE
jgi:hypothetical protein